VAWSCAGRVARWRLLLGLALGLGDRRPARRLVSGVRLGCGDLTESNDEGDAAGEGFRRTPFLAMGGASLIASDSYLSTPGGGVSTSYPWCCPGQLSSDLFS